MKDSVITEVSNIWLATAMDVSAKAVLLALVAGLVLKLARIADPNLRHRVWTGILIAMLTLPVLSQLIPALRLPFAIDAGWLLAQQGLPVSEKVVSKSLEETQTVRTTANSGATDRNDIDQVGEPRITARTRDKDLISLGDRSLRANSRDQTLAEEAMDVMSVTLNDAPDSIANATDVGLVTTAQSPWLASAFSVIPKCVFLIWLIVALVMFSRLALALIASYQLQCCSSRIELSDLSDLALPRELLSVGGESLRLLECSRIKVPVTIGLLQPRVYLPPEWLEWSHEKLLAVLTHERTHIERGDCAVSFLAELNRVVFWFHPLAWWLKHRLSSLAEAACDDAVIGTTGDRTTYARYLLEVASVVARQPGRVSPLGVSMARCSNVETRIRSILDFTRPLSQKLTSVTSVSLLLVIVPIVVIAASLQPRGEFESPATSVFDPTEEPGALVSNGSDNTQSPKPDATKTGDTRASITINGTVLKPDGTPAAGATVRSYAWWWKWPAYYPWGDSLPPLFETTAGSDGRFSLKLPFGPDDKLADPEWKGIWSEPSWKRLWNPSAIVASLPTYGGKWVSLQQMDQQETITLRLVEDVPIRGRIIDLEGKPIAGVNIQISSPTDGKDGSLDAWLEGICAGESAWTVHKKAGVGVEPQLLGIPVAMKSDADGRFEIRGLGPERKIDLAFVGEAVARRAVVACTRKMEGISRLIAPGSSTQTEPIFGSEFIYTADPARIILGTVKDAATGETLAGVSIESFELDGHPIINHRVIKTVSDSHGRFQLIGMPKGVDNQLIVLPPAGLPYLTRLMKVSDAAGLSPVEMQIDLNRGVLITGQVTDNDTGLSVPKCRLFYLPYRSNEFAQRSPEYGMNDQGHEDQWRHTTDAEGRFQLVGLPGKAVIGVQQNIPGKYREGDGYDELTGPKSDQSGRINTYSNPVWPGPKWPTSMREVDIDANATNYSLDFQLKRGASVQLAIKDTDGKAVTGTWAHLSDPRDPNDSGITTAESVQIANNFGPNESRSIAIRHDGRRIGHVARIGPAQVEQSMVSIVLEPFATLRGQLMLDETHAASGVVVEARILPKEGYSSLLSEVATDLGGKFQLDLLPGCKYAVSAEGKGIEFPAVIANELAIISGQQLDLGKMMFDGENFVAMIQSEPNQQIPNSKAEVSNPQKSDPMIKQAGAMAPANSPASKLPASNKERPSLIVGTVRDEIGKAVSGVTVAVTGTFIVEAERGSLDHQLVLMDKAISNTDGGFELKLPSDVRKIENIKVVAGGEGYGIQWREVPSVAQPESFEIALPKLQPIRLRLVDIEGRPAEGVSLKVAGLMRTGGLPGNEDSFGAFMGLPEMGQLWPPSQTTDAEGRCQIQRIGSGTGVFVQVEGNELFAPQTLSINSGEPEERGERDGTYRSNVKNVSASEEAVIPLAPAQIFEGQITLADTGKPAAGVRVGVWASQQEFGSMVTVPGKTNEQGNYRINPQPGIRFGVTAYPGKGEPYLAKTIPDISWGTGLKSKKVDVTLPRGVLIRGTVVDAETKAPIVGVKVQYVPKDTNPNNSDDIITGWQCIERTGEDGTFQISVLPGKGTLIAHGPRDAYVLKEMSALEMLGDRPGGTRNYANAFVPLDLAAAAEPQAMTIEIERGKKVIGKIVDEDQVPIDRAVMITRLKIFAFHLYWRGYGHEVEGGLFELSNLAPGVAYNCSFLDTRRKLGATVMLRGDEPEPIVVLKKCGTAKVRFVTSKGEPRVAVHSMLRIVATPGATSFDSDARRAGAIGADEDFVGNFDRVNYWKGPVSDAEGRMELPALIPDATYRLIGNTKGKMTSKDFTVSAGQTIDLGEIILDGNLVVD